MVVFILLTFVLTIGYRGSLNAVFTVTVIPQPMDTLTELAESVSDIHGLQFPVIANVSFRIFLLESVLERQSRMPCQCRQNHTCRRLLETCSSGVITWKHSRIPLKAKWSLPKPRHL